MFENNLYIIAGSILESISIYRLQTTKNMEIITYFLMTLSNTKNKKLEINYKYLQYIYIMYK